MTGKFTQPVLPEVDDTWYIMILINAATYLQTRPGIHTPVVDTTESHSSSCPQADILAC